MAPRKAKKGRKPKRRNSRPPPETGEQEVRMDEPMPKLYTFVPKGNVFITKHCRQKTRDAEKPLYVVLDSKDRPLGLRCPTYIHKAVVQLEEATAPQRAQAVQKRDAAITESFEEALVRLFPAIPEADIPVIIEQALKKNSRRVGRAGTLTLRDRVKLAVRAHIRHLYTDYDQLLRQGVAKEVAREQVLEKLNSVAREWGGRAIRTAAVKPATGTETVAAAKASTAVGSRSAKKAAISSTRGSARRTSKGAPEVIILSDSD
jgi:hypothetical protein